MRRLLVAAALVASLVSVAAADAARFRGTGYTVVDYGKRELFPARGIVPGGGGSALLSLSVGARDDQLMGVLKLDKRGRVVKRFGRGGIATGQTGSGWLEDTASLVRLPDGRIVVTGTSSSGGNGQQGQQGIGVVAFKANGARDASGERGDGTGRFVFEGVDTLPNFVVPRPGGGFAVGSMGFVGGTPHACIAGFTPGLAVDTAFGSNCTKPEGTTSAYFVDGIAQPDGSVVAGVGATHSSGQQSPDGSGEPSPPVLSFGVAKVTPNGEPDTSFGESGGWTFHRYGDEDCDGERPDARRIAPRPGGGWIVAGAMACGTGLVAFGADGDVDTSFGDNGRVRADLDPGRGVELMTGFIPLPGGKFAALSGRLSGRDLLVARWNADGSLDRTFDRDGRLRLRAQRVLGYAFRYTGGIAARPNGGLLVTATVSGSNRRLAAIALTRSGKLDRSFGVGTARVRAR